MNGVISKRLVKLISKNDTSQAELSRVTGIQAYLISRYVSGERVPQVNNLVKLAKALNTTTDYLVGLSEVN